MTIIILAVGIFLRLVAFLYNRALWIDEAALANGIMASPLNGLIRSNPQMTAPPGFLIIVKAVSMINNSEYAFRLFPLLCGILALVLFWKLALKITTQKTAIIAIAFFAVCPNLIYYCAEVKQYSSDVLICVLLLYCAASKIRWIYMVLLCSVAIWFSHPALFVSAAIFVSMAIINRKRLFTCTPFFISATLFYVFSLSGGIDNNSSLKSFWGNDFLPLPISGKSLAIINYKIGNLFFDSMGFETGFLMLIPFACGVILRPRTALFLVSPVLVAMAAAMAHKYPFIGRLMLFAAPCLILVVSIGMAEIRKATPYRALVFIILAAVLILPTAITALPSATRDREELRAVLQTIKKSAQKDDLLWIYFGAMPAWQYYAPRTGMAGFSAVAGVEVRGNKQAVVEDLSRIHGHGRVWFVFSHVFHDDDQLYIDALSGRGQVLSSVRAPGAEAVLVDITDTIHR